MATARAVIAKPLADGATQEIVTLTFVFTDLVGAAGTPGLAAALIATSDESASFPRTTKTSLLLCYN